MKPRLPTALLNCHSVLLAWPGLATALPSPHAPGLSPPTSACVLPPTQLPCPALPSSALERYPWPACCHPAAFSLLCCFLPALLRPLGSCLAPRGRHSRRASVGKDDAINSHPKRSFFWQWNDHFKRFCFSCLPKFSFFFLTLSLHNENELYIQIYLLYILM